MEILEILNWLFESGKQNQFNSYLSKTLEWMVNSLNKLQRADVEILIELNKITNKLDFILSMVVANGFVMFILFGIQCFFFLYVIYLINRRYRELVYLIQYRR